MAMARKVLLLAAALCALASAGHADEAQRAKADAGMQERSSALSNEDAEGIPRNYAYSNPFLEDERPIPGVCCVCGCEQDNACEEGCEWVNAEHTLCSACLAKIAYDHRCADA